MDYASFLKRTRVLFCIQNQLARECLAELLAVFVLIVSGAGGGWGWGQSTGVSQPCSCAVPTGAAWGWGGLCWDSGDPKPTHLWLGPRLRFTTAQLLFYHQGNRIIEP